MAPGPSASAVMSTLSTPSEPAPMLAMTAPVGYNLRSDPDIKKPECVGCNKAFARRDTVILHMKNQKRKWDLLCTMLPRLIETTSAPSAQRKGAHGIGRHSTDACATWAESDSPWEQSGSSNVTAPTVTTNPTAGRSSATDPQGAVVSRHKPQKQRRSHPYRMVEKLWHSTLQKRACLLGLVHSPSTIHVKKGEDASHITTAGPFHEELDWRVEGEDLLATLANGTNGDEGDDGDENEWLGLQGLSPLGAQAKLIWMMKVMEEPPCWKERKVRMFGAYGVLEEKVLQ
ncbi:hypothetical protein B0O80DRAFT_434180 [Mortierella sp. GBAus27b]|nr:hypothetical protein B0O80DRAFT_434180 [Mortierella sp. GBAus27b]